MVERTFYKDRYNPKKTWEIIKMSGAYYLRQYINGKQFGRGLRTTKRYLNDIGILKFERM